jgi:MFS family permease
VPLALVIALTVCVHAAYAGGRVAVSLLAVDLAASPFLIGVIMSLFAALPMLVSVMAGRWIDRVGMRGPMLLAAAAVAAGTALPAALPALPMLAAAAVVVGSGFMLYHIAVSNLVGAMGTAADRPRNFSLFSMGFSISGFGGPLAAGFAIDHLGFRAAFAILAALPLAAAVVLAWRGAHLPRPRPAERAGERRLADLVRHRRMREIFLVSATLSTGWDLFTFVVPIYAAGIGHSASTIGVVMASFAIATFAVRLVLPALSRRFGEWTLLAAALFTGAAVYLAFPLTGLAGAMVALAFVLGIGLGSSQPMVMSLIYDAAPAGRAGEAVGVRTTLVNASQTFMPLVFGALGAVLGMAPLFFAMAVAMGAAAAATRIGTARTRPADS